MGGEHDHLTIPQMKAIAESREAVDKDASRLRQSIRERQIKEINPSLTTHEIINRIEERSKLPVHKPVTDLLNELRDRIFRNRI